MAGPAKLPARPALNLSPAPAAKVAPKGAGFANVAVIRPGGSDTYNLASTPSSAGVLGRIHTPFKK